MALSDRDGAKERAGSDDGTGNDNDNGGTDDDGGGVGNLLQAGFTIQLYQCNSCFKQGNGVVMASLQPVPGLAAVEVQKNKTHVFTMIYSEIRECFALESIFLL